LTYVYALKNKKTHTRVGAKKKKQNKSVFLVGGLLLPLSLSLSLFSLHIIIICVLCCACHTIIHTTTTTAAAAAVIIIL